MVGSVSYGLIASYIVLEGQQQDLLTCRGG